MTYVTVLATVRDGKVELLDEIALPEDATLLITVLEDVRLEDYSLGDHLTAALRDALAGRVTEVANESELSIHLDRLFSEA